MIKVPQKPEICVLKKQSTNLQFECGFLLLRHTVYICQICLEK